MGDDKRYLKILANFSGQMFQSTPPHGGRPYLPDERERGRVFQSTPPHGGRRHLAEVFLATNRVSIHAPAWGTTYLSFKPSSAISSFNPRPRMGDDCAAAITLCSAIVVSIHAPAWGTTAPTSLGHLYLQRVSIHAPAWGTTLKRLRRELPEMVSIHAPAWGTTCGECFAITTLFKFQSTPPHGGRRSNTHITGITTRCFNPRPRMGDDDVSGPTELLTSRFNPRPRMGDDTQGLGPTSTIDPFQSTPPHGGRQDVRFIMPSNALVSIHAPAWGTT